MLFSSSLLNENSTKLLHNKQVETMRCWLCCCDVDLRGNPWSLSSRFDVSRSLAFIKCIPKVFIMFSKLNGTIFVCSKTKIMFRIFKQGVFLPILIYLRFRSISCQVQILWWWYFPSSKKRMLIKHFIALLELDSSSFRLVFVVYRERLKIFFHKKTSGSWVAKIANEKFCAAALLLARHVLNIILWPSTR